MELVCLVGIDGSGKTSHAKEFARKNPISARSKYLWLRCPSVFSFPVMALCRLLGFTDVYRTSDGRVCTEHHYYRNKAVATIWPWFQLLDAMIFVRFMVYMQIRRGFLLVCDRFLHDVLVDLMVDTGSTNLHQTMLGRLMLALVPQRSLVFVLDVDESTVLMRKNDIPSVEYIRKRRQLYRNIASYLDLPFIDCSQPIDVVHSLLSRSMSRSAGSP